ncbi:unnamed protein product [Brachionus calyciflorus]|uniref:Uncharacterized protein n=1 Tax=Brachionus calyciflorus TaxID=104777 RepID=A0A813ZD43_9BILA|nr:unnamed protein product [Brachionus calyciflorus]
MSSKSSSLQKKNDNNLMYMYKGVVCDEGSSLVRLFEFNDLNRGQPLRDLELIIGSDVVPRFSCECHKLNLAIRKALTTQNTVCSIIRRINKSNTEIRRRVNLNRTFRLKKCRLRKENKTRWSSAYMLLECVMKAYERGLFDSPDTELRCPIGRGEIELYVQILKPAYLLNVSFQSNHSSIAIILRHLSWAGWYKKSSKKFYCAAPELTSYPYPYSIHFCWSTRTGTTLIREHCSIKTNSDPGPNIDENSTSNSNLSNNEQASPTQGFTQGFFSADHVAPVQNIDEEIFLQELNDEINQFKAILKANNNKLIFQNNNSCQFWFNHAESLPKLSKLANIILKNSSLKRFYRTLL